VSSDSESDEEYTVGYSQSEEDRTGSDREEYEAEIEVSQHEAVEQYLWLLMEHRDLRYRYVGHSGLRKKASLV